MLGNNVRFSITGNNNSTDDEVGGAVLTGTVVHENVPGRLEGVLPEQVFLMQGLETARQFTMTVGEDNLNVQERDYVTITDPVDHRYYNVNLRVLGVLESNFNPSDPRAYMILNLQRDVKSHAIQ